jgi:cell pole-organizing protein PopZ
MTTENNIAEPSMDEILASIRQIISTDIPEIRNEDENSVLDLTRLLPEENQHSKPLGSHYNTLPERENVLTLKDPLNDSFISSKTVDETAEAFDSLRKLTTEGSQNSANISSIGIGGQTIENLTKEMLKPLLKEWLDLNLPQIVRFIVNEQVEKILRKQSITQPNDTSQRGYY